MCGICGHVGIRHEGLLEEMTAALAHRGPDDAGLLRDGDAGLGHRRLSIIDVSGGHQPIENEDGSAALVANGEIYNFRELREELLGRGHRFRTESDSEVILHLWEEEGAACVRRLNGMFAFAIWDRRTRTLLLARDRLGIKPLYYATLPDGGLVFASELKALLRCGALPVELDPGAVLDYLGLRYVPGPGSLLRGVKKLPAAHVAELSRGRLRLERYWEPPYHTGPFRGDTREWLEGFGEAFERSIRRRLVSDVPLGAYLSGGVDSGAIVATMARLASEPVRTFTVGFDFAHDELEPAAATARALGCRHTEIACRAEDVGLLPEIVWHLDEPIGDAIVVPMFQLAREAKKHVSVILAGEGADETLGGYLFHKVLLWGTRVGGAIPRAVRQGVLLPLLRATPAGLLNLGFQYPADLGERGKQKLLDLLPLLEPASLARAYRHLISLFDARDLAGLLSPELAAAAPATPPEPARTEGPLLNRALDLQFAHWLPDDILMKQDKVSMAHAVEVRVPFLDHELVEYALSMPPSLKVRGLASKWILRRHARDLLPPRAASRRKMPFYTPVERYLAQPVFVDLLDDLLSERAVRERGVFRPDAVGRLRDSVRGGEFVMAKQLMSLMILELWCRMAVDRRGVA